MKPFYQSSVDETFLELKTSPTGLSQNEVTSRQSKYGRNVLAEVRQKSRLSILAAQFNDVMIVILVIAAVISFVVGEHTDAYVILAIIIGNAWLGITQEYHAEKSKQA